MALSKQAQRLHDHKWRGSDVVIRAGLRVQIKKAHAKMVNNEPLRAVFLPTAYQIEQLHKIRKGTK
jgi:hypothetical protein